MKNYFLSILLLTSSFVYAQQNLEEALRKGGWTGGISGWVGWENYKTTINLGDYSDVAKIDGFNFIFSSRNGSLVEKNGVFGFDFQWREKSNTTKPDPNPDNSSEYKRDREWFIGLWGRYYVPLGGNFAWFLEGSAGYSVYNKILETQSTISEYNGKVEGFANGFAYNAGIGFSNFISPNAAFEITGRWEGGSLNGTSTNNFGLSNPLNVKIGNIFILFGFQVYLR
jgi:hypothetical protein